MVSGRDQSASPTIASVTVLVMALAIDLTVALAMVSSYIPFMATIQRTINTRAMSIMSRAVL